MKEIVVVFDRVAAVVTVSELKPIGAPLGKLPRKSATLNFLLIGVPVGSSTTWNKSADALDRVKDLEDILYECKTEEDTASVYSNLAKLNREYGRIKETIKYNELNLEISKRTLPFMYYFHRMYWIAANYASIGEDVEGYSIIQKIESELQKPMSEFSELFHIDYYINIKDWKRLEEIIPICKEAMKNYGFNDEDVFLAEGYVQEYLYEDYNLAIKKYQEYIDADPGYNYADGHISIARSHRKNKDYKKALKVLNMISDSELLYKWDANFEYAKLYIDKGNISKAIEFLNLYIEQYKYADKEFYKYIEGIELKDYISTLN